MWAKIATIVYLILTDIAQIYGETNQHSWKYPNFEEEEEFPKWGGVCDEGKLQSPINLTITHAFRGHFPDLEFYNYDDNIEQAHIFNNGHSVQIKIHLPKLEVSGGVLDGNYIVEQMHFHWWSEHTIEGRRSPLELHIVHRKDKYNSISDAGMHKDGIAVLGILYHLVHEENDAIEKVIKHIDHMATKDRVGEYVTLAENFTIQEFLPDDLSTYFTYEGSLTTPPCSEVVTWIVFSDTVPVTLQQVKQFSRIQTKEGEELKYNYRNTQKRRNRAITLVQHAEGNSANSYKSKSISIKLIGFIICSATISFIYKFASF